MRMERVRAKKSLGQHFLKDAKIAQSIVESLSHTGYQNVLEIGPGTGALTRFLFQQDDYHTKLIEIDRVSVGYLKNLFPDHADQIIEGDFLQLDFPFFFQEPFAIIGNFPYNISSQILFKVLENRSLVPEVIGMFQKEVGVRIASKPGNKEYGILSVLMQAFYDVELLFLLDEKEFIPPPKVKSAVLRFRAKQNQVLACDEKLFFKIVKAAFNQRRKMLRNALSQFINESKKETIPYLDKRAETLSWQQFVELTVLLKAGKGEL